MSDAPRYPLGSGGASSGPDTLSALEQRSPGAVGSSSQRPVPQLFQRSTYIYPLRSGNLWTGTPRDIGFAAANARLDALTRRMEWGWHSRRNVNNTVSDIAAWRRFGS